MHQAYLPYLAVYQPFIVIQIPSSPSGGVSTSVGHKPCVRDMIFPTVVTTTVKATVTKVTVTTTAKAKAVTTVTTATTTTATTIKLNQQYQLSIGSETLYLVENPSLSRNTERFRPLGGGSLTPLWTARECGRSSYSGQSHRFSSIGGLWHFLWGLGVLSCSQILSRWLCLYGERTWVRIMGQDHVICN